jgi:hypothetical protein
VSARSRLGRAFTNDLAILNDDSSYSRTGRNTSHSLFGEI